jgi:hypothetical protein
MSMRASDIAKLRLPADAAAISGLPKPVEALADATPVDLRAITESFLEMWRALVFEDRLQAESEWERLMSMVVAYYVDARRRLEHHHGGRGTPVPGSTLAELQAFLELPTPSDDARGWAAAFMRSYLAVLHNLALLRAFHAIPGFPQEFISLVDAKAHNSLLALQITEATMREDWQEELILHAMVDSVVQFAWLYEARATGASWIAGSLFSDTYLREVVQLANRERAVVARYGTKRVEGEFETRLALLLQSLGFVVVPARRAERRVDLLSIAPGNLDGFTCLIDGKTSARPYGLPVTDQRALREYVEAVRAGLRTFPPLRLVLIVGGRPAATLDRRLKAAEADLGLPVRFMSAEALVSMRQMLPGPVRLDAFARGAISSGVSVLGAELIEGLVQLHRAEQDAQEGLVRAAIAARDGIEDRS